MKKHMSSENTMKYYFERDRPTWHRLRIILYILIHIIYSTEGTDCKAEATYQVILTFTGKYENARIPRMACTEHILCVGKNQLPLKRHCGSSV